jgi:translation initiation factor IF-3
VKGGHTITTSHPQYRINQRIRVPEVRLIVELEKGKSDNLGIVPLEQALQMAQEHQLDLVEVAPNAKPPVCRIMDYGKFQYERQRRERKARKNQKSVETKEIQLRPTTDPHHLGLKVRRARRWIKKGMNVRVRIRFRGREIVHKEIGREQLQEVASDLEDIAVVDQMPKLEGRTMLMVLTPIPDNA